MVEKIGEFIEGFFKNLKCSLHFEGKFLIVENVPRSFEEIFGIKGPYKLNFISENEGIFAGKGSVLLSSVNTFLENLGKTTLLKIDFDIEPIKEINTNIFLKDCKIENLIQSHQDKFFSRFTFMTSLHYLNESEQIINEIYVHEGKIVSGNLSEYKILEGDKKSPNEKDLKMDYHIAGKYVRESLNDRISNVGEILKKKLNDEIFRVECHYEKLMGELGGDLNEQLEKVRKMELELRTTPPENLEILRAKLERLKKGLVKVGDSEAKERIMKEMNFTIKDVKNKHSLNIDNKLMNTTVIYYPVFKFNLFLKGDNSKRFIEMIYDPLTKSFNKLFCETCKNKLSEINLCSAGHISCEICLDGCGECGDKFCLNCLKKGCSSCGKNLCKNCSEMCMSCGKSTCSTHLREDCVSGELRCVICLRACMRCHGLAQSKYFGEAMDGSKVCQKCLGAERRGKVLERVFTN